MVNFSAIAISFSLANLSRCAFSWRRSFIKFWVSESNLEEQVEREYRELENSQVFWTVIHLSQLVLHDFAYSSGISLSTHGNERIFVSVAMSIRYDPNPIRECAHARVFNPLKDARGSIFFLFFPISLKFTDSKKYWRTFFSFLTEKLFLTEIKRIMYVKALTHQAKNCEIKDDLIILLFQLFVVLAL